MTLGMPQPGDLFNGIKPEKLVDGCKKLNYNSGMSNIRQFISILCSIIFIKFLIFTTNIFYLKRDIFKVLIKINSKLICM